jgi:hypothetical protein
VKGKEKVERRNGEMESSDSNIKLKKNKKNYDKSIVDA